ncbi:hypothetical protein ABH916_003586 [Peribacillus frigoritolerans]
MNAIADKISKIVDGKRVIVKKPELLAPAGNLEKIKNCRPLRRGCRVHWRSGIWPSFQCR